MMNNFIENIRVANLTEVDTNRCQHLVSILEIINQEDIPGDLVETGIYKGGTSLIMAKYNKESKMNKMLFCCDSFIGCPDPHTTKYGAHKDEAHGKGDFACDLETVKNNFQKFDLLDNNVVFVEGWFEDTVPTLPVVDIALLRFDGDLYSSTLSVLEHLYPKVVKGGFVIIDDYCLEACRQATNKYINDNNLKVEIHTPPGGDSCGSWWRKYD